jgi:Domain of unknown function (DUF5919)
MDERPLLRQLAFERHLQTHPAFVREYDKVAAALDRGLVGSGPSRAQLHRWLSGRLVGLPYADHCRVLEAMFPGWTAKELFGSLDTATQEQVRTDNANGGVVGAYPTRSHFIAEYPPRDLLLDASRVRIAGLSLNLLCQQVPERDLLAHVASGASYQCLFLDPDGEAIRQRDTEEGYRPARLAGLTALNLELLVRYRSSLDAECAARLRLAVYDETVRFNLLLVDDRLAVVQAYLPHARGVEAPTFVIENQGEPGDVYPAYERLFEELWSRGKPA